MHTSYRHSAPVTLEPALEISGFSVFGKFATINIDTDTCERTEAPDAPSEISGNSCKVIAGPRLDIAAIDRSAYMRGTVCYSWPEANATKTEVGRDIKTGNVSAAALDTMTTDAASTELTNTYRVECTNNGVEVQFCGHGLLAAAHYWLDRQHAAEMAVASLPKKPGLGPEPGIVLLMGEQAIYVCEWSPAKHSDRRLLSAYLSSLQIIPAATPPWLLQYYGEQAIDGCAMTKAADGYLVVEFHAATDLSALPPYVVSMAPENSRAVIFVTLATANDGTTSIPATQFPQAADYQQVRQRYFAPQYGNPEDGATGSAARAVASYFSSRYTKLFIEQQSAAGGWLLTEYDGEKTRLTGASQCQGREL